MMNKVKICYVITQANGGGIATLGKLFCEQAAISEKYVPTLLVIKPLTDWLSNSSSFTLATLNCEELSDAPPIMLKWLKANPQDIIFFNGVSPVDHIIPFLPNSTYCVYGIHDTPLIFSNNAIKYYQSIDYIACVSDHVFKSINHSDPKKKIFTVSNGIKFISKSSYKQNAIVFLGGNKPFKGAYEMLKLCKFINKQKIDCEIYWCGTMSNTFEKIISIQSIGLKVKILGLVSRENVLNILSKSKILLMLSREEAFGLVTVEAMSQGCIPIAWDIPSGTKDIIEPGISGEFVRPLDYNDYVKKIEHVLEHHSDYIQPAIERVKQNFSVERMFEQYDTLFQEMLLNPPVRKSQSGMPLPSFKTSKPKFQMLPNWLRKLIKRFIDNSFHLSVKLNKYRGI